jgi:hypothetical protein
MNEVWKKSINGIMVREELTDDDDDEPWQYTREEHEIMQEAKDVAVMRPDADLDEAGRSFFAAFETISQSVVQIERAVQIEMISLVMSNLRRYPKALSTAPIYVGSEVWDDLIMATSRAVNTWSSFVGNVRRSKEEEFERALRSTCGERSDEEESDTFGTVMMSDDISLGEYDSNDETSSIVYSSNSEESGDENNTVDDDDDGDDNDCDDDDDYDALPYSTDDDFEYNVRSLYMKMSTEHHPGVEGHSFASWALAELGLEVPDDDCTGVQEMMMKRKRDSDGDDEGDRHDEKRMCI